MVSLIFYEKKIKNTNIKSNKYKGKIKKSENKNAIRKYALPKFID